MNFWWGYALGSWSRGGGINAGGFVVLLGSVWLVMELITPEPPKEVSLDDYKGLIVAAGASCTGMSVVARHARRTGAIMTNQLAPLQDILVDRILHGDRAPCGLPPRPGY
jgi:hypothetical protein